MASFKTSTLIRIDEEIYEELKVIAEEQNRSLNKQIEFVLKKFIDEYEKEKVSE